MRIGWGVAIWLAAGFCCVTANAAPKHSAPTNAYSAALSKMQPADQEARLAEMVGYWCIGTQAFLMGVATTGAEAGNAYWSVACLDGSSYAVQIDPLGRPVSVPCAALADTRQGKECFKKF